MSKRKQIITVLIALLIVAALVWALLPSPIAVTVVEVQRGPFAETVEDEGRTRLREAYPVLAPVSGFLRRVALEPGDAVAAGDVLFELEAIPAPALDPRATEQARERAAAAEARLEAAQAELELREVELELAEGEFRRNLPLYREGMLAAEQMERLRAQRDARRSAVRAARHAVDIARFELESARAVLQIAAGQRGEQPLLPVPAPVAGTITQRHRYSEGPVAAGEPILELGDLEQLEVQVDLLSVDAVRVRPGMRVVLERWGGPGELEGEVRRVEPGGFTRVSALGVEEQRVPVRVSITTPRERWAALGAGYRVEARFVLWEDDDVLQIPTAALFRVGDSWAVFVVEAERARLRRVQTGRSSGLRVQIVEGLRPGEQVIMHPGERLEEGSRVRVER